MKIIPAALIFAVVVFTGVMVLAPDNGNSSIATQADKDRCAKAVMSSIGTSTVGYADNQAYHKHVKANCEGLSINGKPIE